MSVLSVFARSGCNNKSTVDWVTHEKQNLSLTVLGAGKSKALADLVCVEDPLPLS